MGTINQVVDCADAVLPAGMVRPPEWTMPLDSSNGAAGNLDAVDPSPPISRYASTMIDGFLLPSPPPTFFLFFFCFIQPTPHPLASDLAPSNSGWMPRVQPAAVHFKVDPPQQATSTSIASDFLAIFFIFSPFFCFIFRFRYVFGVSSSLQMRQPCKHPHLIISENEKFTCRFREKFSNS